MKMRRVAEESARAFEAELDDYPDERGDILLDAASAWRRAGNYDRAIELIGEAVALGGEDGGNARVTMAEVLFELDRDDEARAHLDALRKNRPNSALPFHLAAELLEERGAHKEALTWFNFAVARLTEQEMATRHHVMSYAGDIIRGRHRVRQELGLPADELDESVAEQEHDPFIPTDESSALASMVPGSTFQVLFWPRAEALQACERWPEIVQHDDVDTIVRERELANSELADTSGARIEMVPLTVSKLVEFANRTDGDPRDSTTRRACMAEIVNEGKTISWPPERNAPCWCGSGRKYKKCCARPMG